MSMAGAMIGMMAVSMVGQIMGGMAANQAAKSEAHDLERQAEIARQEALVEAERLDKEHTRFIARQSLMFIKGGVSLSGSPLLVLAESREEREKQVQAQINRANAQYMYGMRAASRTRAQGRQALIGGIAGAATSGTSMYMMGSTAGIFGAQQTATPATPTSPTSIII